MSWLFCLNQHIINGDPDGDGDVDMADFVISAVHWPEGIEEQFC